MQPHNNNTMEGHGFEDWLRDYPILGVFLACITNAIPKFLPVNMQDIAHFAGFLLVVASLYGQWDQWQLRRLQKRQTELEIKKEESEQQHTEGK